MSLERCTRVRDSRECGYALVDGICPICAGKQVSDRLPMPAPMPKHAEHREKRAKVFALPRHRRRSA